MSAAILATIAPKQKLDEWVERFRFYRQPPSIEKITDWLSLFKNPDKPTAVKILDNVKVVSEEDIQRGYKAALSGLNGWNIDETKREGRWYFVGFGRAGDSGQHMLRIFREANRLAADKYDSLFCHLPDLPALKLTAMDHVVFVDDISASGRQVKKIWPMIAELVASEATCFLILTAVTTAARDEITNNTDLVVKSALTLKKEDNIFHDDCTILSTEEKDALLKYCKKADKNNPKGFSDCGLMIVLAHKTPNNTIPVLHVNQDKWRGLFPRYLNVA